MTSLSRRRHLTVVVSNDQLAASAVRHTVLFAELVQQPGTFDAVPGFERSRRVVDAGVDDLAVVRARPHSGPGLAFEHACRPAVPRDRERGREADDPAADHRNINGFHTVERALCWSGTVKYDGPVVPSSTIL